MKSNSILSVGIYTFGLEHPLPEYATEYSACFDLRFHTSSPTETKIKSWNEYNVESYLNICGSAVTIPAASRALIPTGMIFALRPDMSMRIHPRSGLSIKKGLTLVNAEGIVDADYREPVYIPIINTSRMAIDIVLGERIAQAEILMSGISMCPIQFHRLDTRPASISSRQGGFGSTGSS